MAELYRRYSRRLYCFGMQVLGNTGLAEKMVQESFVRLWRTAAGFDARRARRVRLGSETCDGPEPFGVLAS